MNPQSAVFLHCRFSLFLKDRFFFQIILWFEIFRMISKWGTWTSQKLIFFIQTVKLLHFPENEFQRGCAQTVDARIQKVLSEGVQLWCFFLFCLFQFDEGRKDPNTTISWPSKACQRNAILMAFHWPANDGPILNAGLVALWIFGDPDQYC